MTHQQGTPFGALKDSVELPNGVTLGLLSGGRIVATATENNPWDGARKIIDSGEAALWLFHSIKGEFPEAPTLDTKQYTRDAAGNLIPYPDLKPEGQVVQMPDGSRMKLIPAD